MRPNKNSTYNKQDAENNQLSATMFNNKESILKKTNKIQEVKLLIIKLQKNSKLISEKTLLDKNKKEMDIEKKNKEFNKISKQNEVKDEYMVHMLNKKPVNIISNIRKQKERQISQKI
jgi:hypothetical protein